MSDKLSHLIKLIDSMPEAQAKALLQRLFQDNPLLAFKIISRQFGFSDLRYANEKGIAALLDSLSKDIIMRSLNGAEDALVRTFTNQMPTREAADFIDTLYASRASDAAIKESKKKVLIKAFLLQRKGLLIVNRPGVD